MTKIEKDEVLNIGNHLSMDVYANQEVKIGRDYSHQTSRKCDFQSWERIKTA